MAFYNEGLYRDDVFRIGDFSLTDTLKILLILSLYLFSLMFGSKLKTVKKIILPSSSECSFLEKVVFLSTGLLIMGFYILRFIEIRNTGYSAYHSGDLIYTKTFLIVILEIIFFALSLKLVSRSNKIRIYDIILLIYFVLMTISGFRFPGLAGLLMWFILKRPVIFKFGIVKSFLILPIIGFFPFLLILLQRIRNGITLSPEVLIKLFKTGLRELIVQLNFTVETLRVLVVDGVFI